MAKENDPFNLLGKKRKEKGAGTKKYGRNRSKCAAYRIRVGKPHKIGNKRGRNKV